MCEYVISPVSKYAGVWGIPLLTAAAQADGFAHKTPNYPLLTRMMGSYRYAALHLAALTLARPELILAAAASRATRTFAPLRLITEQPSPDRYKPGPGIAWQADRVPFIHFEWGTRGLMRTLSPLSVERCFSRRRPINERVRIDSRTGQSGVEPGDVSSVLSFCDDFSADGRLSCREVGAVMVEILARFDWRVVGMLFHNHDVGKGVGNSPCHFALAAVYAELDKQGRQSVHKSFDETNSSVNFTQLLVHIAQRSRSESRARAPCCERFEPGRY